ncbi:MAG: hypothetical protein QW680_01360 [Pyrobaculum sp.]
MIIATYLPIFRAHELEIFKKNVEIAKADEVVVCIDYYFDERQDKLYQEYAKDFKNAVYIKGNWRNRSSCLLRLVRYIMDRGGDGLIVDSDVLLPEQWPRVDAKLDLPFYHMAHDVWRHKRVTRHEVRGGVDVYYWKVKSLFSRTMQIFAGPKLVIRYKQRLVLKLDELLEFIDAIDTIYSNILADETVLGIAYDINGIKEVPFIIGARHLTHRSYPQVKYDNRLYRCIYSRALIKLFRKFNYNIPFLRYLITRFIYCL